MGKMYPNDPNQPNPNQPTPAPAPQPQPPYQPPQTGINSAPQQATGGQYEVVPPPNVTGRPTGHNPYEFIVSPNAPKRSSLFGGSKFMQQLVFLVGGAVVVVIVIAVIVSMLFPGSGSNKEALTGLAQQQQEISRVAELGTQSAAGQLAKAFAVNTQLSIATSQQQVLGYLAKSGTKLSNKTLSETQNSQTDAAFQAAQSSSNFDSTMVKTLNSELQTYENSLANTFKKTKSTTLKTLLNQNYNAASLLLQQGTKATD